MFVYVNQSQKYPAREMLLFFIANITSIASSLTTRASQIQRFLKLSVISGEQRVTSRRKFGKI
jgi:hypothetical protein